jgi:hypothetical protein
VYIPESGRVWKKQAIEHNELVLEVLDQELRIGNSESSINFADLAREALSTELSQKTIPAGARDYEVPVASDAGVAVCNVQMFGILRSRFDQYVHRYHDRSIWKQKAVHSAIGKVAFSADIMTVGMFSSFNLHSLPSLGHNDPEFTRRTQFGVHAPFKYERYIPLRKDTVDDCRALLSAFVGGQLGNPA